MYYLLGDQLTTAQDHAAQDRWAVDHLDDVADHLTSHAVVSGVMHVCMNKMISTGCNAWGGTNKDAVSLLTLCDVLPNRENINLEKHDFHTWLQFLDVVLRSLTIMAAMAALNIMETSQFPPKGLSKSQFLDLLYKNCGHLHFPIY